MNVVTLTPRLRPQPDNPLLQLPAAHVRVVTALEAADEAQLAGNLHLRDLIIADAQREIEAVRRHVRAA